MTSVRRALLLSLVERYLLIVIALGSNVVLARLFTPDQVGVYSVSLAVIGIAQVLRDFGIGSFLIQEKDLSESHIRTAFGLSLIVGVALFSVMVTLAPWIGEFYSDARIVSPVRISALNFLVLPFCTISMALLRREMQFKRLLYISILAALAGFAVTVVLALAGVGLDSLAIGAVVSNVVTGLGAWFMRPQRRLLLAALSSWRSLFRFGAQTSIASVVTRVAMDINDLYVARVLGFAPVALMSRAQGLMNLFHLEVMTALRNVAYPAFAEAHREHGAVPESYARIVSILTAFAWPFYGLVALYALEVIRLLYGDQWVPAAPLVPYFCLAGAVAALNGLTPTLLVATGHVSLSVRAELILQPLRVALIVTVAHHFRSMEAVVLAYLASAVMACPVFLWFLGKAQALRLGPMIRGLLRSGLLTAFTLSPAVVHVLVAGPQRDRPEPLPAVAAVSCLCVVVWFLSARWLRHALAGEPMYERLWLRIPTLQFKK